MPCVFVSWVKRGVGLGRGRGGVLKKRKGFNYVSDYFTEKEIRKQFLYQVD